MAANPASQPLSEIIGNLLPYLRRHARALTGSQQSGDRYAAETLEALLVDRSVFSQGMSPRVALYYAFHQIWSSLGEPVSGDESGLRRNVQRHLRHLTPRSREALLLHTIEEFSRDEVAQVMDCSSAEVDLLLQAAAREMEQATAGRVLIIEDAAIIALDLQTIVAEMGHQIIGVAATEQEALRLAKPQRPDLILSDIQLADGSSGIDAVNHILADTPDLPVIFITAFPERLLTGERPEPAFVITKPYTEEQIRSAVSQAMFFASTETLSV